MRAAAGSGLSLSAPLEGKQAVEITRKQLYVQFLVRLANYQSNRCESIAVGVLRICFVAVGDVFVVAVAAVE